MSAYVFRGRLCGYICSECPEPLSDVVVRLYRTREKQPVAALAVADPKETFQTLTDDEAKAKTGALIAETRADANGHFVFELGDKQNYHGEAFEIDIYCGTVPRRPPGRKPPKPRQFSITTLQPLWRESERGLIAAWEYCLPQRIWCLIRALFGAWTICGRVRICDTKTPLAGVKVRAFDADWLQDDELGSAVTDGQGKFRIDYLAEDFLKTPFSPFINIEWVGGPDLYFKVEALDGTALLTEDQSRGRKPDRQNAGPCFCVELCVDTAEQPPFLNPWFTHVGDFDILADIDSVSGLTNKAVVGHGGPTYGFVGGTKLKGFCPKTSPIGPALPMRYRFLFIHPSNPLVQVPITGSSMMVPVIVGSRLVFWDTFGTGASWTPQSIYVAGSVADVPGGTVDPTPIPAVPPGTPWGPPPPHVISPDANGWIEIDQSALDGGFYGPLLRFNTGAAVPGGVAPGSGPGIAPVDPKNGINLKIIFEAGPVGQAATFSNALDRIHINNWTEVRELNLQQFLGGGGSCSGLTNALDILYTTDHELMAAWSLQIVSAANPPVPVLPSGNVPRGGFGTHHLNIAAWPSCSYQVWLHTRRAVTDGETDASTHSSLVTFCK